MKTKAIISSALLTFAFFTASAQKVENKIKEADVPAVVKTAFAQKYPGLKAEQWELDNGKYEVDFDGADGADRTAVFSSDGKWLITGKKIKKKQLPQNILDNIKSGEFKDWKIAQIREAETPDIAKEIIVEVEKGVEDYMLYYDASGNFLRKKKE